MDQICKAAGVGGGLRGWGPGVSWKGQLVGGSLEAASQRGPLRPWARTSRFLPVVQAQRILTPWNQTLRIEDAPWLGQVTPDWGCQGCI